MINSTEKNVENANSNSKKLKITKKDYVIVSDAYFLAKFS
jgi:hypothetical protein